jgi:hypothetical protein
MNNYKFKVSVVARHLVQSAEEIVSAFGREPRYAWSVGDSRITPNGTQLPGTRQDTMCSFRFAQDDDQLTQAVTMAVEHLRSHRSFVSELLASGGTLDLNIGFNGQFNSALDLSPETLRSISELGIRISVECFPDG